MKILHVIICLALVIAIFTGCATKTTYPPIIPAELTIEEEIIRDYYYNVTSVEFQMNYFPEDISLRFRGVFSDTYVVFVDGPFESADVVLNESVNGSLFRYIEGKPLLAYHQGSFYSLTEAFDLGYLTESDIYQLKLNYTRLEATPANKGDVPTERLPCTHNTEPSLPPEPTQTSEPVDTSEPTAPSEPVDWNVLLPDIPAVTDPCEKPQNPTADNLVYTLYDYTISWTNSQGKEQAVEIQLPAIVPFCDGAIEINEDIRNTFKYTINGIRLSCEKGYSYSTDGIYYAISLVDHFLTIRTFETTTYATTTERFWILDISTGERLETPDLAQIFLEESYPVFLHHCTNNLIEYFTANPLEDADQQSRLIKSLTNETASEISYTLYLDFNGTLMLDISTVVGRINGFEYNVLNRGSWDYTEQDSYHWLFHVQPNEGYSEGWYGILVDCFFQTPHTFVAMLTQEDDDTIEKIARRLNFALYLPEEIAQYKELCDDVYITTGDEKIRQTVQILLAAIKEW